MYCGQHLRYILDLLTIDLSMCVAKRNLGKVHMDGNALYWVGTTLGDFEFVFSFISLQFYDPFLNFHCHLFNWFSHSALWWDFGFFITGDTSLRRKIHWKVLIEKTGLLVSHKATMTTPIILDGSTEEIYPHYQNNTNIGQPKTRSFNVLASRRRVTCIVTSVMLCDYVTTWNISTKYLDLGKWTWYVMFLTYHKV